LRIDNTRGDLVIIDNDEIIYAMALEKVQDFDRQSILVHGHGINCHQIGHETFANLRVRLKVPCKIAVCENAQQFSIFAGYNSSTGPDTGHGV
jgi:hypothetical protein